LVRVVQKGKMLDVAAMRAEARRHKAQEDVES